MVQPFAQLHGRPAGVVGDESQVVDHRRGEPQPPAAQRVGRARRPPRPVVADLQVEDAVLAQPGRDPHAARCLGRVGMASKAARTTSGLPAAGRSAALTT